MQVQGTRYPVQAYTRNIYRVKCALKNLMSHAEVLEHDQPLEAFSAGLLNFYNHVHAWEVMTIMSVCVRVCVCTRCMKFSLVYFFTCYVTSLLTIVLFCFRYLKSQ